MPAAALSFDPRERSESASRERPVTRNYRWPTPPYASFPADIEQAEAHDCEITAIGGRRVAGKLTFFLPEQDALEFQLPRAATTQTIYFGEILTLRLTRPVRIVPERGAAIAPALATPPAQQPFQLVLVNGEIIEGKTLGHVSESFGTFLFPPVGSAAAAPDAVERLFVPRAAVRELTIGGYLGQMLVDHNIVDPEDVEMALAEQTAIRSQRLGDYLLEQNIVSEEQLIQALAKQQSMPVMRLGEALIQLGMVTPAQLDEALEKQREDRSTPLGRILVNMGVLTEDDVNEVLARKLGFPVVDLDNFPVDATALRIIPDSVVNRLKVVPVLARNGMLIVALEDPMRVDRLNEIRFLTQLKVVPVVAPKKQIEAVLHKRFGSDLLWFESPQDDELDGSLDGNANRTMSGGGGADSRPDINALACALDIERHDEIELDAAIQESDNTLVRLVNTMILDAYSQQASDIHIENYPERQKTRVRFRKDGGLVPYLELPASYRQALVARIKIMADLDISERRKPQDGKIDFSRFGPAKIELRVATIPTTRGLEDVVMRVLVSAKPVPLDKLGLSEWNREQLRRIMEKSYGLMLVCGPTGSGKTTTLHSALSYINVPERKIWTAEDPVEITQPGLRQVQVNPKIGWTFAHALRSFLRADPDVIMVGEMRDQETARIGVEASLTGHLVLSTLHTNSAPESITRLLDMGVDPFNFADSLLGVLAQRLAKKLCTNCCRERSASPAEVDELLAEFCFNMPPDAGLDVETVRAEWLQKYADGKGGLRLYGAKGCAQCSGTGYRGRIALHELLVATPDIKRLAQHRAELTEIQHTAIRAGMRTLKQDGITKILQGLTDLAQVRAVSN